MDFSSFSFQVLQNLLHSLFLLLWLRFVEQHWRGMMVPRILVLIPVLTRILQCSYWRYDVTYRFWVGTGYEYKKWSFSELVKIYFACLGAINMWQILRNLFPWSKVFILSFINVVEHINNFLILSHPEATEQS